jgi:Mu transposase-like protein
VFTGPGDFTTQLASWLSIANRRQHRTLQARPIDRWEADRAGMLTLPPVDPPRWWRSSTRIGRDHYVRVDTCDYSVHPLAIGKKAVVRTDTDEVIVTLTPGGAEVARHPRCWARHQTITDPHHAHAADLLRDDHRHTVRATAARRPAHAADLVTVEQRRLDAYDHLLGILDDPDTHATHDAAHPQEC